MNLALKHALVGFFSLVILAATLFVTAQLKEKNEAKVHQGPPCSGQRKQQDSRRPLFQRLET